MPPFAAILHQVFLSTVAFALVFYALCYGLPRAMVRLNSMPWTFYLSKNLDLDFQSVTYAAYHTTRINQITHWPLVLDQIAWLVVLSIWSPVAAGVALALLVVQALLLRERAISAGVILMWALLAAAAAGARAALGDLALPVAEFILIADTILRTIGHSAEPMPPMMGERGDRFVPMRQVRWSPLLLLFPFFGYISEFCAGLPFRLVVVQAAWLVQRLGARPEQAMPWPQAVETARQVHDRGWRAFEPVARLLEPYLQDPVAPPPATKQ